MRLIDADKTIGLLKIRLYETAINNASVDIHASQVYAECADNRIEAWIDEMPTVEAEPVVRCKDCKWRGERGCAVRIVDESDRPKDDDFCSWGERREE